MLICLNHGAGGNDRTPAQSSVARISRDAQSFRRLRGDFAEAVGVAASFFVGDDGKGFAEDGGGLG